MNRMNCLQGVRRAFLVLGVASLIPACGLGGTGNNVTGGVNSPLWNSVSGTSQGMSPSPGSGPIWNGAGTVLIFNGIVTGLDVTYSEADLLDYPNINIPNAKPPIVKSAWAGEPVTSSGILDPNGFEAAVEADLVMAWTALYPPNQGFGGLGGFGGGFGGFGGGLGLGGQPPTLQADDRVRATARGYSQTIKDMGALPPTPANPAETNPTPPSLNWRLEVAGGHPAAITSDAEFPVMGQVGGTGHDAWNTMQGNGNAVSAAIGGLMTGDVLYYGAGYRGDQNAIPGPLNFTDLIVVVGTSTGAGTGF